MSPGPKILCSRQHGALLQPLLGSPFFHDHDVAEGTFNKFYAYGFSSTPVFLVVFFFGAIFHCVTKSDAVKFHGMGSFTIPLWLFYALAFLTCRQVELVMLPVAGVPLPTHRCASGMRRCQARQSANMRIPGWRATCHENYR